MTLPAGNIKAGEGQIWVCDACWKRSKDKYGYQAVDQGWDASCMLHAVLCFEKKDSKDKWVAVPPPQISKD